jgi:hypothetical protein
MVDIIEVITLILNKFTRSYGLKKKGYVKKKNTKVKSVFRDKLPDCITKNMY